MGLAFIPSCAALPASNSSMRNPIFLEIKKKIPPKEVPHKASMKFRRQCAQTFQKQILKSPQPHTVLKKKKKRDFQTKTQNNLQCHNYFCSWIKTYNVTVAALLNRYSDINLAGHCI